MPLQRPKAVVEMRKLIDTAPDLGALSRDEVAQLGGYPFAIAGGAQDGQLPSSIERQVQRAQAHQEPKPLHVGRRVASISVRRTRRCRQQAGGLVEPNGLCRRARLASEFTDLHTRTVDLPVAGMSSTEASGTLRR